MDSDHTGSLLAFLVGGVMGAGLALLFAPRTGRETREYLKEYAGDLESRVKHQVEELKDYTTEEVNKLKDKTKAAVEEGKKAFKEELGKLKKDEKA